MKPIGGEPRRARPAFGRVAIVVSVVLLAAASIAPGPYASARRPNHLLGQSSPYLLEHLDNPVDWYPWGDEALALARREQKPIFLSIGYSACHWCHVMAREAFSDEEIARILNQHFVSIKVDRQERPDLDALYMEALQAMTGGGGWPMSLFLTPDLKPFYGGTYFPRDEFRDRLLAITSAWDHNRQKAIAAADSVQLLLKQQESEQASGTDAARPAGDSGGRTLRAASAALVTRLEAAFDRKNGGFGTRPKFPPHGDLWLLLDAGDRNGRPQAPGMVVRTLDAMARGGIYDQIGGGFHRYATDEHWRVPHFEKMLYDNALLIPLYLEVWKRTGRSDFRRVAEETIAWAEREMADSRGSFCASLDADSAGEEGAFYLWTRKEARAAIGEDDADLALAYFGLSDSDPSERSKFEGDRMLPHLSMPLAQLAAARGVMPDLARSRLEAARQRLFDARSRRERPRRDDTILTSWNGLMISALAKAARQTGDPRYLAAATRAARNVLATALDAAGRPRVSFIGGRVGPPGTLDDSAFLARGLLDLYDAGSDRFFLDQAARIVRDAARFFDPQQGGYFLTTAGRPDLIARTRSLEDGPLISGNAAMVECLGRLSARLGDPSLLEPARRTLEFAAAEIGATSIASPYLLLAARFVDGSGSKERVADAAAPVSLLASPAMAADSPGAPETRAAIAQAAPAAQGDTVVRGTIVGRANPQPVVSSSITAPSGPVRPGQSVTLSLRLEISPGWHINSAHPTLSYLIPTRIEFSDPAAATVEDVAYPEGKLVTLEFAQERLSVYEGSQTVRATLSPPADAPAGRREIPARVTYQACSNKTCLAPETIEYKIPIDVQGSPVARAPRTRADLKNSAPAAGGSGAAPAPAASGGGIAALLGSSGKGGEGVQAILRERGLLVLLGVVFLAGLALNLTPCVYPMMPVTIGFFVNQASGSWRRRAGLPALYVLGMAVTYSLLGVLAGLTGSLFGSWLQSPWVTGTLVLIFIIMALSMFGLFEIRMPGWLTRFSGGRQGAIGAFLMGLTMGVAAAPCIGPFIVPLLAFVGAAGKPVLGFWLFFVMAVGMGLPNLFLGFFSGAIGSLPRSGTWLIYAKKVMGVALLAVALYFVQPFLPDRRLGIIVLGFACASGAYLALLEGTRMAARWFRPLRVIIGLSVVAAGAWVALPMINARPGVDWRPYSAEALEQAKAAGRPVILDFFADWCLPCKELDRFTFSDPVVIDEGSRFLFMKADMTSFESQTVRALRERFGIVGVPTVILIDGQGTEHQELRVYGFEDPPAFLERMRQVR